ncbi:Long chain acyl-CoA synthetase 4 [Capsicum baccatum]|uniref:Long-chain-fatty-acid--CoA ligase n=1 Tax=Capsicum baccatum TaxID=33114 RepID=A0A2G2WA45_CAPBA|nr:Long chain acyl-CoA synthetase 4 [Capsicum baccatum]
MSSYTVKVEESRPAADGKPSAGPVYRSIYAKHGLMEMPTRFDFESPWNFFSESVKKNPKYQMLGRRQVVDKKAGPYNWLTYEEVYETTVKIGSAIRSRGVNPGDRCSIYGVNCPEWIMAMEGCNSQAISYVPLYDSLGANAMEFIINHAEVSIAFAQESKIPAILSCLSKCHSYLKTIVSLGIISSSQKSEAEEQGVACFSWEEFVQMGRLDHELPQKRKTDICSIMYTSGTTGEPKGVILTNDVFMGKVLSLDHLLAETDKEGTEEDVYFSFLPLAHIFDQIIETYCIYRGASIGFWQGDVRYLIEDLLVLKPTIFCGVPRVYDRIYTGVMDKIEAEGALKKLLFHYAYNYKLRNMEKGLRQDEAAPRFDRLVFNKIKLAFGGRVRLMFSGAAPLPKHVEEFLRVTCCSSLTQGYGLTESCGGSFTSIANVYSMTGTVGVPMTTIEARLESVPEMGYDALESVPRGEICLRGTTLFSGYHKREDLTKSVLVDGWLHTGDIGEWQPDGAMKIIDRKKNIFKLSQGEYVAVEIIEGVYSRCPLVTSIWIYGNSFESFLVAVVVPERKALEDWASSNQQTGDFSSLCNNTKARKYILDELNSTARKHQLRGFEMLGAVHLEPNPFDIERELVTPTFKLRRSQLLNIYKGRMSYTVKVEESGSAADGKPSAGRFIGAFMLNMVLWKCLLVLSRLGTYLVESILGVTFESLGAVTRSKANLLGQQTHPVSSGPAPVFGSSTLKGIKSNEIALEGGSSVVESLKKTLALLEHSGSKYFGAKSDDRSSNSSSSNTQHKLSTSKVNLRDNLCYSPTSPVIMQAMMTDASSMEEQLPNLAKAIEGLTKYVQNQNTRIDKIVDRVEVLIDRESSHSSGKAPEVHEIENPVKQTPPTKQVQVSSEGMIPIGQLREFIEGTLKDKYAKPYTARIDNLKMPAGYQPPKFQQFEGKGNPK